MIRFHENLRISVKKTSPSERRRGHASSGNLATVESRRVHGTAPLAPAAVKNFSPLSSFVPNSSFHFRRKALRDQVLAASRFPQTFLRYYFLCYSILVSTFHHTRFPRFKNSIHECRLVISYECRLFCFLLIKMLNRWLELKILQGP
jgi:hypothetical protein